MENHILSLLFVVNGNDISG